jgi:hypothetical protein
MIKIEVEDPKKLGLILFQLGIMNAEVAEAINRAAYKLALKEEGRNI